ncbi:MAG: hypothetical protein AAGC55_26965, partial [Myxococcota bacterium]
MKSRRERSSADARSRSHIEDSSELSSPGTATGEIVGTPSGSERPAVARDSQASPPVLGAHPMEQCTTQTIDLPGTAQLQRPNLERLP